MKIKAILGLWFIVSCVSIIDTHVAKAQEGGLTVEGEWEVMSVSDLNKMNTLLGAKVSIVRKGDGYEVTWLDGPLADKTGVYYTGSEMQIVKVYNDPLPSGGWEEDPSLGGAPAPASLAQEIVGITYPDTSSYTLSDNGNSLQKSSDAVRVFWTNGHYSHYIVVPGYYKSTLRRVSNTSFNSSAHGDHAYPADCSNPKDMCLGNLVAMTNFCGGSTSCSYVCCPKGLPYLNHCDCKCYATADFDCHSHSFCTVQPQQ